MGAQNKKKMRNKIGPSLDISGRKRGIFISSKEGS